MLNTGFWICTFFFIFSGFSIKGTKSRGVYKIVRFPQGIFDTMEFCVQNFDKFVKKVVKMRNACARTQDCAQGV